MPRHPLVLVGGALVIIQGLLALLAPWIAPYDPIGQNVINRLEGPSLDFLLGADQFGRDNFSRILYGYRASIAVSLTSVTIALVIGGSLGVISAFYRGWTDRLVMRSMASASAVLVPVYCTNTTSHVCMTFTAPTMAAGILSGNSRMVASKPPTFHSEGTDCLPTT